MTLRPTFMFRWLGPIASVVVAGLFIVAAYRYLVDGVVGAGGICAVLGLTLLGIAAWSLVAYIRVDEAMVVFGPRLLARSSFRRSEIALIRATHSPFTRRTVFVRADGTRLYSTPGTFWGIAALESLAN